MKATSLSAKLFHLVGVGSSASRTELDTVYFYSIRYDTSRSVKLLRPLHRQRTRRRNKARILNSKDLLLLLEIEREDLEAYLNARRLPFHKDSCGEIWLSTFTDDELTEQANELIPNSNQTMDLESLITES